MWWELEFTNHGIWGASGVVLCIWKYTLMYLIIWTGAWNKHVNWNSSVLLSLTAGSHVATCVPSCPSPFTYQALMIKPGGCKEKEPSSWKEKRCNYRNYSEETTSTECVYKTVQKTKTEYLHIFYSQIYL